MYPHFPDQIIISLASLLRTNHTLVHLELGTCNIDSDGALQLASALNTNNTVQRLQLTHDPIGFQEAAAFAEILRTNHILAELNLQEHGSYCGTCQLAGFLQTSQVFYMSVNQIGAMAGAAETLLKNKSLRVLKLYYYHGDSIGEEVAQKLIESLKQNATLNLLVLPKEYESSFTSSGLDSRVVFRDPSGPWPMITCRYNAYFW